uniref:Uncharacterized protein n=1 Tax=Oryza rufipogon TaxID=4529 RepID=A0A0E0PKE1_ORYRU
MVVQRLIRSSSDAGHDGQEQLSPFRHFPQFSSPSNPNHLIPKRRGGAAEPATAALARPHDSSAQGCRVPQEQVRGWAGERGCVAFDGDGPYTGVSDGRVLKWIPLECRWVEHSSASHNICCLKKKGYMVARLLPITLGQVFQRIDVVSKDFGNIVDVELGGPWLLLPVEVMATLAHKFGIIGEVGFCVQC